MAEGVFQVQLRRLDTSQPWGFRLKGGADQGVPLHVEHCGPKSRAANAGVQAGDIVLSISGVPSQGMTHAQVKQEVLRAGNEVDFVLQRGGDIPTQAPGAAPPQPMPKPTLPPQQQARQRPAQGRPQQQAQNQEPRAQVLEEPTVKLGGPTFKQVKPKTYQVLDDELPASETGQVSARPASIFNRNKAERSGYLQAKGRTIQKAYGQN